MKTFNLYWCSITFLVIWFLLIHSPPYLIKRWRSTEGSSVDIPFAFHLLGAYSLSFACIINALITPTAFGGTGRNYHVLIGKVAMIGGIIEFLFGFYCCWWPGRTYLPPQSFSIGVTIGGINQLWFQYRGYNAITEYRRLASMIAGKKEMMVNNQQQDIDEIQRLESEKKAQLLLHIESMLCLFVMGCGAVALIRIFSIWLPDSDLLYVLLGSLAALLVFVLFYVKWFASILSGGGHDAMHYGPKMEGTEAPPSPAVHSQNTNARTSGTYRALD